MATLSTPPAVDTGEDGYTYAPSPTTKLRIVREDSYDYPWAVDAYQRSPRARGFTGRYSEAVWTFETHADAIEFVAELAAVIAGHRQAIPGSLTESAHQRVGYLFTPARVA